MNGCHRVFDKHIDLTPHTSPIQHPRAQVSRAVAGVAGRANRVEAVGEVGRAVERALQVGL